MNIIGLGVCLFLKLPLLLFKYINKENKKMGKKKTLMEYLCYISDLINIWCMVFLIHFSSLFAYYIWIILVLILLFIYYIIFYQYFSNKNMHIIYGRNKINLPTIKIEIAIPIITALLTLQPVLVVSAFIYAITHYQLEVEAQKRIRFR